MVALLQCTAYSSLRFWESGSWSISWRQKLFSDSWESWQLKNVFWTSLHLTSSTKPKRPAVQSPGVPLAFFVTEPPSFLEIEMSRCPHVVICVSKHLFKKLQGQYIWTTEKAWLIRLLKDNDDSVIDTIRAIIKTEEGRGKILPKTLVLGMNIVSQFACSAAHFQGLVFWGTWNSTCSLHKAIQDLPEVHLGTYLLPSCSCLPSEVL